MGFRGVPRHRKSRGHESDRRAARPCSGNFLWHEQFDHPREAQRFAQTEYAPAHLRAAKDSYDHVARHIDGRIEAIKKVLSANSYHNVISLHPASVYGRFGLAAAQGALSAARTVAGGVSDIVSGAVDLVRRAQRPQSQEEWYQWGSQGALLTVAATELLFPNSKVGRSIVLPSGSVIQRTRYEVDGTLWPKEGLQTVVYRDPADKGTVFKLVTDEYTASKNRPKTLTFEERVAVTNGLFHYQNEFGQAAMTPGRMGRHVRVDIAGDVWLAQPFAPGWAWANWRPQGELLRFKEDYALMMNAALSYAHTTYPGGMLFNPKNKSFGKYQFIDHDGLFVMVDSNFKNFRHDPLRDETHWFDTSTVWPSRITRGILDRTEK